MSGKRSSVLTLRERIEQHFNCPKCLAPYDAETPPICMCEDDDDSEP